MDTAQMVLLSQCEAEQQTYATHWYEHWIAWVELLVQYTVLHNSPLLECATGSSEACLLFGTEWRVGKGDTKRLWTR
jgi:hypothetical protein